MVSIVIVSHSPDLAKGIHALAEQMTQGKVQIATAAGVDDDENPLGTDAIAIMMAIEEVYVPEGVIIFVDMGSAMLSTDMALELIDPDMVKNISVCAAPIVEGVISASVAAMAGKGREEVIAEAHQALAAKYELLNQSEYLLASAGETNTDVVSDTQEDGLSQEYVIKNPHGLHARPAAAIVAAMGPINADILIMNADKKASGKSINSIALLGVKLGDTIRVSASGVEAQKALDEFTALYEQNFLDSLEDDASDAEMLQPKSVSSDSEIVGIGVSGGKATAPLHHYKVSFDVASERAYTDFDSEQRLFVKAKESVIEDILSYSKQLIDQELIDISEIFQAHAQMLEDPELDAELDEYLREQHNVEKAWLLVVEQLVDMYQSSDSSYMQARVKDVQDIGQQILYALKGKKQPPLSITQPCILIMQDLLPSQAVQCNNEWVKGIAIEASETNSHSVFIAKALGIPTVVGAKAIMQLSQDGKDATIDGEKGSILLDPK